MIHSLLAVCLLAMGVGAKASTPIELNRQETPTQKTKNNINYRQTNNAGIVTEYTLATCDTPTGATTNNNITKIPFQAEENDALKVQSIIYITDKINYAQKPQSTYDSSRSSLNSIQEIQITPYLATIENTLTLNLMTYVRSTAGYNSNNNQVIVRNEIIYGQGTLLEQSWDQNNWSVQSALWNTFQTIKSNNNTWNYQYIDHLLIENQNEGQLIQDQINITIPKDSENTQTYVYACTYFLVTNDSEDNLVYVTAINGNPPIRFYAGGSIKGTALNVTINYEVIDLPSLMWEILSMPFSFISTAFNLTLFKGTPYQVNLSNLFMMIFGVLVFIFILKMLLKK